MTFVYPPTTLQCTGQCYTLGISTDDKLQSVQSADGASSYPYEYQYVPGFRPLFADKLQLVRVMIQLRPRIFLYPIFSYILALF